MPATFKLDQAAAQRAMARLGSAAVTRAGGRVRDAAKANVTAAGRVDTGQMRNGITAAAPRVQGSKASVTVTSTAEHSRAQHDGTGIFGPSGRPIVPRRARVLRFRPKGSATFVFAPSVRGVKGTPFMADALKRISPRDYT